LGPLINSLIKDYNAIADADLPTLKDGQLEELAGGANVTVIEKRAGSNAPGQQGDRYQVVAYRLIKRPRTDVWIALRDPHFAKTGRGTVVRLNEGSSGTVTSFTYLPLPWPMRDRYWVTDTHPAPRVSELTAGRVWQIRWALAANGSHLAHDAVDRGLASGLSEERLSQAIYLPENTGAWTLFCCAESQTLLVFQSYLDLGGWIPESVSLRSARGQLDDLLLRVAEASTRTITHYDADARHPVILGGDGLPLAKPLRGRQSCPPPRP